MQHCSSRANFYGDLDVWSGNTAYKFYIQLRWLVLYEYSFRNNTLCSYKANLNRFEHVIRFHTALSWFYMESLNVPHSEQVPKILTYLGKIP